MSAENFVREWRHIERRELVDRVSSFYEGKTADKRHRVTRKVLLNEVRPSDLFCYLGARFGPPNGFQNFLRANHSDNLIHWEWSVDWRGALVNIQGLSFRSEIWVIGDSAAEAKSIHSADIAAAIKRDFGTYGKEMSEVRHHLERWIEFVNPYQRIRQSLAELLDTLRELRLGDAEPSESRLFQNIEDAERYKTDSAERGQKVSLGLGLCFGIRSMLPVLAESFVNLLLYVLMRPELKKDGRLRDHTFREPIDVRIKKLSINCLGFERPVDYSAKACSAFHSLINERNDLLHGNVAIEKLKFNELYFWGTVPVFNEYRTMWERSVGVMVQATGLAKLESEVAIVDDFVDYILSCLAPDARKNMQMIMRKGQLGLNEQNGRIGVLFADYLVDAFIELDDDASDGHSPQGSTT